jgi:hypothetical protein
LKIQEGLFQSLFNCLVSQLYNTPQKQDTKIKMKKFSKELIDYYDLEESQCIELEKEDLIPDNSKEATEKYNKLIQRGIPFTMNEI